MSIFKKNVKCQGQKIKYQQKDFITGNIIKALALTIQMLLIGLKYSKEGQTPRRTVTRSKRLVSMERICNYKYSYDISNL